MKIYNSEKCPLTKDKYVFINNDEKKYEFFIKENKGLVKVILFTKRSDIILTNFFSNKEFLGYKKK